MNRLRASNFRRIHTGLLLDLLLLLAIPAVLAGLLVIVDRQVLNAGVESASVTAAELLSSPSLVVKLLYAFLALAYCLAALCALLVVSGLGELEAESKALRRAKRWFVLLAVTEGVAMLAHITDVVRQDGETLALVSSVWVVSLVLLLSFRALGLRAMLRCFGELMESVGATIQSRRALRLSRCIIAAAVLPALLLIAACVLYLFDLQQATKLFIRALAVPAFLFYFLCRIQAVLCARAVTRRIAELSE